MISRAYIKLYRWFIGIVGLSKDKTTRNLFTLFTIALIAVVVLLILDIASIFLDKSPSFGTFGDFLGGVLNPILTFLMFMGLLITIILQHKELRETREEFKNSSEALKQQSESIKIQNFENTFFKLVSLHNEIVDSLEAAPNVTKRKSFTFFLNAVMLNSRGTSEDAMARKFPSFTLYDLQYDEIANAVEHYHKNLFQILSFIDQSQEIKNKKRYTKFIRSQLSRNELALLFFHGLSKYGKEKFKPLIERYSILEHIPEKTFLLKENMYFYQIKAFGDNPDLSVLYTQSDNEEVYGPPIKYGY